MLNLSEIAHHVAVLARLRLLGFCFQLFTPAALFQRTSSPTRTMS